MTKKDELHELALRVDDSVDDLLDFIEQISDTDILRQAMRQIRNVRECIDEIIFFSNELEEEDDD